LDCKAIHELKSRVELKQVLKLYYVQLLHPHQLASLLEEFQELALVVAQLRYQVAAAVAVETDNPPDDNLSR
jgi:hypothetical protein